MSLAILFHFLCAQRVSDIACLLATILLNSRKLLVMDILMSETC